MLILEEGILTAMMICSKMVGLLEPGDGGGLDRTFVHIKGSAVKFFPTFFAREAFFMPEAAFRILPFLCRIHCFAASLAWITPAVFRRHLDFLLAVLFVQNGQLYQVNKSLDIQRKKIHPFVQIYSGWIKDIRISN